MINKTNNIKTDPYHNYYANIGLNISYYRKKSGLTQEELAELIGISRAFLSAIEAPNIDKVFSLPVLFDICKALNIEPYQLFVFDR